MALMLYSLLRRELQHLGMPVDPGVRRNYGFSAERWVVYPLLGQTVWTIKRTLWKLSVQQKRLYDKLDLER